MERAWNGEGDLARLSVNSMTGLWASNSHYQYSCKASRQKVEGVGAHATRFVELPDGVAIFDFIYRGQILDNCSYRPIRDQITHTKHTLIAHLL